MFYHFIVLYCILFYLLFSKEPFVDIPEEVIRDALVDLLGTYRC